MASPLLLTDDIGNHDAGRGLTMAKQVGRATDGFIQAQRRVGIEQVHGRTAGG